MWEVFVRSRAGLAHQHVGSLHAADAEMALANARDVYTRRGEGASLWVVPAEAITTASTSEPSSRGRRRPTSSGRPGSSIRRSRSAPR